MGEVELRELVEDVGQDLTVIVLLAAGAARVSDRVVVGRVLVDVETTARVLLSRLRALAVEAS